MKKHLKEFAELIDKPILRTHYSFKLRSSDIETVKGVSETVPDMAYSIRDILSKYVTGVPPSVLKNGNYTDDPDFDDYDRTNDPDFDLVDVQEMQEDINTKIMRAEQRKQQTVEAAAEAELNAKIEAKATELAEKRRAKIIAKGEADAGETGGAAAS